MPKRLFPTPIRQLLEAPGPSSLSRVSRRPHMLRLPRRGNTVAHLCSCPTHAIDLAPGDMWPAPLQVPQFLVGLPHFSDLNPLADRLLLLPFLTLTPPVGHSPPHDPRRDNSPHLIQWSGGQTPLLTNNSGRPHRRLICLSNTDIMPGWHSG